MGGGVCNMYTGTLVDVINEATIKTPDANVAGIHHRININAANSGTSHSRLNQYASKNSYGHGYNMSDQDKANYRQSLQTKGKLPGVGATGRAGRNFVKRVSAGSGVNYGVN